MRRLRAQGRTAAAVSPAVSATPRAAARGAFVVAALTAAVAVAAGVDRGQATGQMHVASVDAATDDGRSAVAAPGGRASGGPAARNEHRTSAATGTRSDASSARLRNAGTAGVGPHAARHAARANEKAVPAAARHVGRASGGTSGPRLAETARATRGAPGRTVDADTAVASRPSYAARADVRAFVDDLVARSDFDRDALMRRLAAARYSETAARLMAPAAASGGRRDWTVYRARFVEPVRLAAGLAYWDAHEADLARAEREFGVPAEIIVGILGVETVYGRNTGNFRVLDALATLSFDYPASPGRDRSAFFREQLADAFAMDRAGTIDLGTLRGSYAGAIGMPQFMPGSIRQFAIDFDGDGRIDLVGDAADIVGSVANFLAQHGWVRDLPTQVPLVHRGVVDGDQAARIDAMVASGSEPHVEFADLVAAGFVATTMPPLDRLALIDLPSGVDADGAPLTVFVAGTQNFHVITRYNRSYFYAMSVIELGGTIRALREARR